MIKLIVGDERPDVDRTIHFEFRRHRVDSNNHLAYLVGRDVEARGVPDTYPVKVDGRAKIVEIRKRDFEALGFTVVIKD